MDTISIDIDIEVFEKLKEMAIPFVDTTPNLVLRRFLGLSMKNLDRKLSLDILSSPNGVAAIIKEDTDTIIAIKDAPSTLVSTINQLRSSSSYAHPAFLTFLMDKYWNTNGNYKTSQIISFLEKVNLRISSGAYRNPWMPAPYKGEKNGSVSCTRTIEHFRQTRKFGCWGGKDIKTNCDAGDSCNYHPDNPSPIKNKCDLRKGVIWKRANHDSPYEYGKDYVGFIKRELLTNKHMPLKPLLSVFYPKRPFNKNLVNTFKKDFHFNEREMELFSLDFDS